MNYKKKFNDFTTEASKLMKERPLETIAAVSMAAIATAKLINSVTEARNSSTWKKEVNRRTQNQKN